MLCAKCGLEIRSDPLPSGDEELVAHCCVVCGKQAIEGPEADTRRGFMDRLRRFGLGEGIRPLFQDRRR
jgi:hypothetical protein